LGGLSGSRTIVLMGIEQHPSQHQGPDEPVPGMSLADECVAFLRGTYAAERAEHGYVPEAWVALNRLAHASPTEIRLLALGAARTSPWITDEQAVARALVAVAPHDEDIESMQHVALVPLELWLVGDGASIGLSAKGALALAADAIDVHAGVPRRDA
jgi:hypothetical protein